MVCSSRGIGQYVAAEEHTLLWGRKASDAPGLVSLPGSHSLARDMLTDTTAGISPELAKAGYAVISGDIGQTTTQGTFGNDTAATRTGQLKSFLQSQKSVPVRPGPVTLLGGSGGAAAALAYARLNPANVKALVLYLPLVDLQDVYENRTDASLTQAEIRTAFGGSVPNYSTYSALVNGTAAAIAGKPILMYYSTDDPYISVSGVMAFRDQARNAGCYVEVRSLGPVGHTITGVDPADVVRFVASIT